LFVQRDLLALQVGHGLDGGALGHQHGFGLRALNRRADVGQRRAGGLREDGRRLAHVAEVDGADVQRLQLHRAGGELGPLHAHAQRRQALFERAAALEQREVALLVADAQLARRCLRQCGERRQCNGGGGALDEAAAGCGNQCHGKALWKAGDG
jgi:hypothetical protein